MVGMNKERLMSLVREPRITEKATRVADKYRQIVFKVARDATKPEIKQAVELMFEVAVENVRISNVHGKRKMSGRRPGHRSDWKKAYVKLKPGSDIDFVNG